jgi:hypothetical protein
VNFGAVGAVVEGSSVVAVAVKVVVKSRVTTRLYRLVISEGKN